MPPNRIWCCIEWSHGLAASLNRSTVLAVTSFGVCGSSIHWLPSRIRTTLLGQTQASSWSPTKCKRVLAPVAVERSPSPPRSWAKTAGSPQGHVSDARDRRDGLRQARVCHPWKTGPQHRGPRLGSDEVGPTLTVPLHGLRGTGQHAHGDSVQRPSLRSSGMRPGREPARRGCEPFCDRPGHGPFRRWCTTLRLRRGSCRLSGHGDRCGCTIST